MLRSKVRENRACSEKHTEFTRLENKWAGEVTRKELRRDQITEGNKA